MTGEYHQCPGCGYPQKLQEDTETFVCRRCGKRRPRRRVATVEKRPDDEMGTGFVTYTRRGGDQS